MVASFKVHFLSTCYENTLCYVLEKKTCSTSLCWIPHFLPPAFFSQGRVLFSFKSAYFHRLWGTLIFTSSILATDIITCPERLQLHLFKKKQKEREKKKRKRLLWFVQSQDTFCWLRVVFREPYTVQHISESVIFLFWWWRCIDICSSAFILCFLLFLYKPLRKKLRDVWVEGWNFYVALT